MTDEASSALANAWQEFDTPLRMRKGFDENAYLTLKTALQACAESWVSLDAIPRLGANILVDIFPATEGNVGLYTGEAADRVMEAAYELQELVGECVGLDTDLPT
ncbi:hypothetical protein [Actinacidiphila acididurans]|nr:hypothetical protein [Actinacidiphila acididurans]